MQSIQQTTPRAAYNGKSGSALRTETLKLIHHLTRPQEEKVQLFWGKIPNFKHDRIG